MRRSLSFPVLGLLTAAGMLGCSPSAGDVQPIHPPQPTSTRMRLEPATPDHAANPPSAEPKKPEAPLSPASPPAAAPAAAKPVASATPIDPMFALAKDDPGVVADLVVQGSARVRVSDGATAASLGDRLEPFLKRVFFSGEAIPGSDRFGVRRHAIQAGDTPWKLAPLFKIDPALIERVNPGAAPTKLRIGQRIKIVDLSKGELEIGLDLQRHRLALWHLQEDGSSILLMFVPVATGAATTPTPAGVTAIARRVPPVRTKESKGDEKAEATAAYPDGFLSLDANKLDVERLAVHAPKGGAKIAPATVTEGDVWMAPSDLRRLIECVREGTRVVIR